MTGQQSVICQNCHTEMAPGRKTRSRVMEWAEYTCPNCGSIWSEGKPLPGHEPKLAQVAEAEAAAPAKKQSKKKVPTAAAVEDVVGVEEVEEDSENE